MKTEFMKKKYECHTQSLEECKRKCKHHCKKCNIGEYDYYNQKCICYEKSDKEDYDKIIFKIKHDKKYSINKIAFWITFTFFMIFVAILIYFFIKIFFTSN